MILDFALLCLHTFARFRFCSQHLLFALCLLTGAPEGTLEQGPNVSTHPVSVFWGIHGSAYSSSTHPSLSNTTRINNFAILVFTSLPFGFPVGGDRGIAPPAALTIGALGPVSNQCRRITLGHTCRNKPLVVSHLRIFASSVVLHNTR